MGGRVALLVRGLCDTCGLTARSSRQPTAQCEDAGRCQRLRGAADGSGKPLCH